MTPLRSESRLVFPPSSVSPLPPHPPPPLGVASEFVVNTCNAGSGALSVTIDGPSKVKMDCQECSEGYKVTYTPMAPGSYLISIKYGGPQHIVGSPFKAKVSGGSPWALIMSSVWAD